MDREPAGNRTSGASPQRADASGSSPERTVAEHGQILAKIEHPAEFLNGRVAGGDFVLGGRCKQPFC
jgi:hypothetical protein